MWLSNPPHFSTGVYTGKLLGATAKAKALPAPFSESVKEKAPDWGKKQAAEMKKLIEKISGKGNAKLKAKLLTHLNTLVQ